MISRHEEGGDEDQNLIMNVDSVAFFERSIFSLLESATWQKISNKVLKKKIEWMYDRMTSPELKEKYKKIKEKALKDLK